MTDKAYCGEFWRLYDTLSNANNKREFVAQQCRDVGSPYFLHLHHDADVAAKLAQAALQLHKENCDACKVMA